MFNVHSSPLCLNVDSQDEIFLSPFFYAPLCLIFMQIWALLLLHNVYVCVWWRRQRRRLTLDIYSNHNARAHFFLSSLSSLSVTFNFAYFSGEKLANSNKKHFPIVERCESQTNNFVLI